MDNYKDLPSAAREELDAGIAEFLAKDEEVATASCTVTEAHIMQGVFIREWEDRLTPEFFELHVLRRLNKSPRHIERLKDAGDCFRMLLERCEDKHHGKEPPNIGLSLSVMSRIIKTPVDQVTPILDDLITGKLTRNDEVEERLLEASGFPQGQGATVEYGDKIIHPPGDGQSSSQPRRARRKDRSKSKVNQLRTAQGHAQEGTAVAVDLIHKWCGIVVSKFPGVQERTDLARLIKTMMEAMIAVKPEMDGFEALTRLYDMAKEGLPPVERMSKQEQAKLLAGEKAEAPSSETPEYPIIPQRPPGQHNGAAAGSVSPAPEAAKPKLKRKAKAAKTPA